jgi:hypothetical protein
MAARRKRRKSRLTLDQQSKARWALVDLINLKIALSAVSYSRWPIRLRSQGPSTPTGS